MADDILILDGLRKYFRIKKNVYLRAVDGVSLTLRRGETVGLVGESGSGKSTIAYCVAGMYIPTDGRIVFRGREIGRGARQRSLALKKEIQIVFQDPGSSLNPRQSIGDILALPLHIHGNRGRNRKERIAELLDMVELPADYMHEFPHALSGGERQLVAVARALATEPSLILLDEPTSALDVSVQAKVISMLMRIQRQFGLSYLFISHDLSLMRNVASRVAIMYLGKVCEVANTEEFFGHPLHPYTQMLLSSIPVVSSEEEQLRPRKVLSAGEIPSPVNVPQGCSFHTRCPWATDFCHQEDPTMRELRPGHFVRCHYAAA